MAAITTPARVRNRIQATVSDVSDDVLNELIADEQAYIEAFAQTTFAELLMRFSFTKNELNCALTFGFYAMRYWKF